MLSCVSYKQCYPNSGPGDIESFYSVKYVSPLIEAILLSTRPVQFVVALDIIEDFLEGEGFKYLRLVSEASTWLFDLVLLSVRTEIRSNRNGRKEWMNSIVMDLMFSYIFSPRELAGSESTYGAQTPSLSSILISIPTRYVLAYFCMFSVYLSLPGPSSMTFRTPNLPLHSNYIQAIARAHRYGQTKPCLVFKLMAKDTAEGMR